MEGPIQANLGRLTPAGFMPVLPEVAVEKTMSEIETEKERQQPEEKDERNDEEALREDKIGDLRVLCFLPPLGLSILA